MPIKNSPHRNRVNWGNPLTRGLVLLTQPGVAGGVDVVSNKIPTKTGFGAQAGQYGLASNITSGTSNGLNYGSYFAIPTGSSTYSIVAVAAPTSTSAITHVFAQGDATGSPFPNISLQMNIDANGSASPGKFAINDFDNTSNGAADSTGTPIDGGIHVFGGTRNGTASTSCTVYLDGKNVTGTQLGPKASVQGSTARPVVVSGIFGLSRAANYPVYMVAVWNRVLTAAEHALLADDPYQLFAPIMRPRNLTPSAAVIKLPFSTVIRQAVNRASTY